MFLELLAKSEGGTVEGKPPTRVTKRAVAAAIAPGDDAEVILRVVPGQQIRRGLFVTTLGPSVLVDVGPNRLHGSTQLFRLFFGVRAQGVSFNTEFVAQKLRQVILRPFPTHEVLNPRRERPSS